MKTSEIFRAAKDHLWDGSDEQFDHQHSHVCFAIESIKTNSANQTRAKRIIHRLIKPHFTFGDWLRSNHGIEPYLNRGKLQQTRHAWLDHLIAHYESIGD